MLLNRQEMLAELQSGVIMVNFTKVNGTKRNMRCTLLESYLPKRDEEEEINRAQDLNRVTVWDLDKKDWRSFRLDSVNHIFNPAPESTPKATTSLADIIRS